MPAVRVAWADGIADGERAIGRPVTPPNPPDILSTGRTPVVRERCD